MTPSNASIMIAVVRPVHGRAVGVEQSRPDPLVDEDGDRDSYQDEEDHELRDIREPHSLPRVPPTDDSKPKRTGNDESSFSLGQSGTAVVHRSLATLAGAGMAYDPCPIVPRSVGHAALSGRLSRVSGTDL
jgi:hypothetical protein